MTVSERSERSSQDDAIRFPSLDSLRAAHTDLIKRFRASGRTPEMVAEVEQFIRRGAATGALLDTDSERWSAQSQLDYWATQLYQPGYEPPDATLDEFDPELAPELDDSLCPYMGLDAFREANETVFFGRRRLIAELVSELKTSRFLAVLGSSGSGKSSVVRAGLLPELKRGALPGSEEWIYFPPMVPGSHPLVNLARLMLAEADADQADKEADLYRDNGGYLTQTVKDRFKNDVVLVIDQFEEIFTLCTDDAARQCFVENLIALCKAPDAGHRVIITMRSDFEMNIARLPALQDLFEKHVVRVTPLTAAELREAIDAPAARIGLKFEEGVVDALLSDTLGEPAALPLLQFTLLKLWERREHNRVTWESYKKLGGGRQALANSADQVYLRLIPEQKVTMRRILLKMVRPGEGLEVTSNRVPRASLYQKAEANDRIDRVLERLIKERLVRRSEGDMAGDEQVEIAHEALVRNWPRLVEWLEEERVTLRQRQRLTAAAEEWQRLDRDPSALWRGVLLDEVRRYDDLNELEKEFVAAGSDAELAERKKLEETAGKMRKRAYYLTAALAVALVAVIAAINFGFESRNNESIAKRQALVADDAKVSAIFGAATAKADANAAATSAAVADASAAEAKRQTELALASRLVSQAQLINETQPSKMTVGLLLAIQSLKMSPSGDAAQILQNSLQKNLLATPRIVITHNSPVYALAYSLNGEYVATSSLDGMILISNATNGEKILELPQDGWATSVAFSPDGRYLVSGTDAGHVILWDVKTGDQFARMSHDAHVYDVAFSSDGRYVASSSEDHTLRLWDAKTGDQLAFMQYEGAVYSLAFSPDGERLVAGSEDRTSRVLDWKRSNQRAGQTFEGPVYAVAFSPDGKYVASGSEDGTALVWDVTTGVELSTALRHEGAVYSVAFSPNGKYVISGGADRTARIWNPLTSEELFRFDYDGVVSFVSFSPDGEYALAGGEDGTPRIWDIATGEEVTRLPHDIWVNNAIFSPDGSHVLSGSDDNLARIWPTLVQGELQDIKHDGWINAIAFSPDGNNVAVGGDDNILHVWSTVTGAELNSFVYEGSITAIAFNTDGNYIVSGSVEGSGGERGIVHVWEVATGDEIQKIDQDGWVTSVNFSPDGKYVASSACLDLEEQDISKCSSAITQVWDVATGAAAGSVLRKDWVTFVAFSPDGRQVLSGSNDGTALVWEAMTGDEIISKKYDRPVSRLAFSSDGEYVVSSACKVWEAQRSICSSAIAQVWDVATGKEMGQMIHDSDISSVAFSPDGQYVVSGSYDGTARVWVARTGLEVSRLTTEGAVNSVAFSPDGKYVVSGGDDGTARVWEATTGVEIGRTLHDSWVILVTFSSDGEYAISASANGTIRIWIWDPQELISRVCSRLPRNLTHEEWSLYLEEKDYEATCPNLPEPLELEATQ